MYRGIHWTIKNWAYESEKDQLTKWNYYINLFINRFEDKTLGKKFWPKDKKYDWGVVADYYSVPIIDSCAFHGGVTAFTKYINKGPHGNRVEIGCDYQHLWDEGREYNVEELLYDVKRTIDAFHSNVKYLIWSQRDGNLYREDQGTYNDGGMFYHDVGQEPIVRLKPKPEAKIEAKPVEQA